MEKVVAITVTFNSSSLLELCVKALLKQTEKVFKIVIVDNHSNEEHIKKIETFKSEDVDIVFLSENTGGAGGFEVGMRYAKDKYDPDWYWLMDDDAFPNDDCLEKLLNYKEYENLGCLCPSIYGVNLNKFQVFHHKKLSKYLTEDITANENHDQFPDLLPIEANAFVGPLIKKTAVDEIGFANGGLFIYGDDTEYTYRLTRKFKMFVVKNAIINHRDMNVETGINPKAWWKDYYMFRNRFLFCHQFKKNNWQYFVAKLLLKKEINKRILATLLKRKYKGYRKLRINILKSAKKDGENLLYGKTLNPQQYLQTLNERK